MPIENKGQFNQIMNAALEKNKNGKIEGGLMKTTVTKLINMLNSATIVDQKDSKIVKQSKEKLAKDPKFQQEIYNFILRSALSKGSKGTEEYHASKFDKDQTKGLGEYEMNQWVSQLNSGIMKILQYGSVSEFQSTEHDIKSDIEESKFNPQYYLNGFQLGDVVTEGLTNITGEEAQKLLEAKRGDQNFMKGLAFAVLKEGTQSIQDILVFFADILAILASGGYILTQYLYYRGRYILTDSPEYKAKMDAMCENHPILGLVNMVTTEEGRGKVVDLLQSFGDPKQLTAQKIAIGITTIVGLIGGGIGLVKGFAGLTSRFASKLYKLEKTSKAMVKVRKISMDANRISRKTGKVVKVVDNVVDPLGNMAGKGLGVVATKVSHLTTINKGIKNTLKQKYLSGSANQISDTERLSDAEQLLAIKLTPKQQQAIIKAHNVPMGNNIQKGKILRDAGFTDAQTRELMETGVCGWFHDLFTGKQNQVPVMKVGHSKPETELVRIQTKIETLNVGESVVISLGGKKIEVARLTRQECINKGLNPYIEFFILDRQLMTASANTRGYKALRPGEKVTLGRGHLNDRFDYAPTTSEDHVTIELNQNGKVIIKDLNSTNGTFVKTNKLQQKPTTLYTTGSWVMIPKSDGSTSRAQVLLDLGNGSYKVRRTENGRFLEKVVEKSQLDQLNSNFTRPHVPNDKPIEVRQPQKEVNNVDVGKAISTYQNSISGFEKIKLSDIAKQFIQEFGSPKHTVDLGGSKLYVTDVLLEGGKQYLLGYTSEGDMRMFYRSGSEGERRSCSGLRNDGGFGKGEGLINYSYETTTKLVNKINSFFDLIPRRVIQHNPIYRSADWGVDVNMRSMAKETTIDKMFSRYSDAVRFYKGKTTKEVIVGYQNLQVPGLDMNSMTLNTQKGYTFKHDYLGNIKVNVVQMNYNGKMVDVHFANAVGDQKVFVTNIVYSDAKVNSFGIYDKQINAGPITAKPIDYAEQAPIDGNFKMYGHYYVDIRDLYQDMPLIREYRRRILHSS